MRARRSLAVDGWYALAAAFQFLSRIPLPVNVPYSAAVFRRSVVFYPAVGCAIGLLLAAAGAGLASVLPTLAAAALLTLLWVGLTGGLHLDGLMDTADGVLSHRPREQMLEIMKDSRVGAMGALACGLQLLLKWSFLAALLEQGQAWGHAGIAGWLSVIPVWSRWFMVVALAAWPYARQGPGIGALFQGLGPRHVFAGTLAAAVCSWAALAAFGCGAERAFLYSAGLGFTAGLLGYGAAACLAAKLGGLTGDTYGAVNELLETALLLAVLFSYS